MFFSLPDLAVATVGLTEAVITLVYALAIGLSMGTTAMVARRIGEKDSRGAMRTAIQAIVIGSVLSLPITAAGIGYAPKILELMGASRSLIESYAGYMAVMLAGNVTIMLLYLINAIFRGAGDAAIAMRVLWIANAINIVLDPCLIFGLGPFPELGIAGAAVATNIGRGIGVIFQLYTLFRGQGRIRIDRAELKFAPKVMLQLLRVSLGGVFQILVGTASWVGLTRIVSMFGSEALAGYTIALRLVVFAILPSWGLSNAAANLLWSTGVLSATGSTRDYLFFRLYFPDLVTSKISGELITLENLHDGSTVVIPNFSVYLGHEISAYLRWSGFLGKQQSEFGGLFYRSVTNLGMSWKV
ncbi:MAG: MATE family efflux transporter [candidate division KSB1 bacterium]|nr:MATE family efflux transporter [candidate division KSB1 bacterium]MDZ7301922.1 MATE family efflux transporter [candidate division KSB1 bacterium]MDZ7314247.1 MATE family efflux transporter [candidate division KSB1 bacterium]